jgi:hypothetical protein
VEGEAASVAEGVCPAAMAPNANIVAAARTYFIGGSLSSDGCSQVRTGFLADS